jgi:hypothetical protein
VKRGRGKKGEKVKRERGEKGKNMADQASFPFPLLTFSPLPPPSINLFPF